MLERHGFTCRRGDDTHNCSTCPGSSMILLISPSQDFPGDFSGKNKPCSFLGDLRGDALESETWRTSRSGFLGDALGDARSERCAGVSFSDRRRINGVRTRDEVLLFSTVFLRVSTSISDDTVFLSSPFRCERNHTVATSFEKGFSQEKPLNGLEASLFRQLCVPENSSQVTYI